MLAETDAQLNGNRLHKHQLHYHFSLLIEAEANGPIVRFYVANFMAISGSMQYAGGALSVSITRWSYALWNVGILIVG